MSNVPATIDAIERTMIEGDLSALSPEQRTTYYMRVCTSLGLNPLTKPFAYLRLNGKLVLYALKDCTEQLRKINGVSIVGMVDTLSEGVYIVKASARDKSGREDMSTGAVAVEGLKGEAKANAMMKAETKAKRRVTLSICGLGILDETEVETIPGAVEVPAELPAPKQVIMCAGHDVPMESVTDLASGKMSKPFHRTAQGKICTGIPLPEALPASVGK